MMGNMIRAACEALLPSLMSPGLIPTLTWWKEESDGSCLLTFTCIVMHTHLCVNMYSDTQKYKLREL